MRYAMMRTSYICRACISSDEENYESAATKIKALLVAEEAVIKAVAGNSVDENNIMHSQKQQDSVTEPTVKIHPRIALGQLPENENRLQTEENDGGQPVDI